MIEIDSHGYPTEESLQAIKVWRGDLAELLEMVQDAWYYPERALNPRPGIYTFSTGGWSGNEDLLGALKGNFRVLCNWDRIELTGGLFCIATTNEAKNEMDALHKHIVTWCWKETPNEVE